MLHITLLTLITRKKPPITLKKSHEETPHEEKSHEETPHEEKSHQKTPPRILVLML